MSTIDPNPPPVTPILPATGFHAGVPYDVYDAWPAINYSRLKHMRRSPLHCRWEMDHPKSRSQAMILGSALHASVFEPHKFAEDFALIPNFDRRTKQGKEDYAAALIEAGSRQTMDKDDLSIMTAMAEAVRASRAARRFIESPGQCEISAVWADAQTQLPCKGRLDRMACLGHGEVIVELKTTRDASPQWFARDVARYGYAAQAASYLHGCDKIHNTVTPSTSHVIIAVENTPPHAVAIYMLEDQSIQTGLNEYLGWLKQYAFCLETNSWPGYPDKIETLNMPAWAQQSPEVSDE